METCDTTKTRKRKFVKSWLTDDRYKSWLREVPADNTVYHCIICNKNFSCNASYVSRHADSACHKNSIKDNVIDSDSETTEQTLERKQKFRHQWLDIKEFQPWLREVPNNEHSAFCSICSISITAGVSRLHRHAESTMHRKNLEKNNIDTDKWNENLSTQNDESLLSFDERKKSAEIKYAALIAEKNIPHQTANEILKFFQQIGDINVLKSMSMGPTKCQKIISNVLCPVETERVATSLQNTKFSIFIDETSDITNDKWMTFFARYVDSESLDVRSQLVKLMDIDATDCSAAKLFHAFESDMYKLQLPFNNILALSCDNASVMIGKHMSFQKELEKKCKKLLTLPCPCHSSALAAHAACATIPTFCEEFLRNIVNFINSSPKRTGIFKEFCEFFQDTNRKLLKLCDTRWLSRYASIARILELWDTIKYFLTDMVLSDKTKSAEKLLSTMNKLDTKAYFLFLKYALNFFNAFNAYFQALETRIHMLHSKSVNFLMEITQNFLKPEKLKDILLNISLSGPENHKNIKDIYLGPECEEYLATLLEEGHADVISNIRQNCLQFYIVAAEEIRKRLPVNDVFLYKLQSFLPRIALLDSNRETSFIDVSFVAKSLSDFDANGLKEEWLALYYDFTYEKKQDLLSLNFDDMWKHILKRQSNNVTKYPNLKSLVNAIRSLPHSNADPERTFSLLTDLKTHKRNRLSSTTINATCVLKSALKTRGETALDIVVNEKHLSLMSTETLYTTSAKKPKHSLHASVFAADPEDTAGPSSSNDTQ